MTGSGKTSAARGEGGGSRSCFNVLYLQDHAGIGGAQQSLLDFLGGLPAGSVAVKPHVVVGDDGFLAEQLHSRQIPSVVLRFPEYRKARDILYRPAFTRRLTELCEQWRIDLIHANTSQVAPWSAALGGKLGLASCVTCREIITPEQMRKYRVLDNGGAIAISRTVAEQFPSQSNVRQIYNAIACPDFVPASAEALARLKIPAGARLRVAFLGSLSTRKGPHVLLEAAPAVLKKFPEALFVFMGGGKPEFERQLRAQAQKLGIVTNVVFTGPLANGAQYLSLFDLFVMPSLAEPLGRGAVEAMYAGLPVVASSGGLREIVEDGRTGRLVAPNDPTALAEAISAYLRSESLRREHGEAGRVRARELFDPARYATRVAAFYTELVDARRNGEGRT